MLARLLLCALIVWPFITSAQSITIASAANFKSTLERLSEEYKTLHQGITRITIITASSGVLFAQISHGAPFDIFLSANASYADKLAADRQQKSFSYATGKLVFWMPENNKTDQASLENFNARIAIANPVTAPYGIAAIEVLQHFKPGFSKIIKGSNVNQAYQFMHTGNVKAGLLALAQVNHLPSTQYWTVPDKFYSPIEQRGIVLKNENSAATSFARFIQSPTGQTIITQSGYGGLSRTRAR